MFSALSPEQWAVVQQLFLELVDLAPADREARLASRTADAAIADEVRALLNADARARDRFETPALQQIVADGLADYQAATSGAAPGTLPGAEGPSLLGRRLGPYEVVRRIGEGGMGTVYEAVRADGAFAQRVAIKTVWRDVDSQLLAKRLRSERQILATLQHPNIAALIDGGSTPEGLPYLVMEYVEGAPIDEWCDARALPISARLDLFRQVCAAVAHAHRHLIVHRDLKPSNVFVSDDGTVKLLDFGVAKLLGDTERTGTLTSAGVAPFTAAFAAPEQVSHEPITTVTDVYALGALLFLLLTGRTPINTAAMSVPDMVLAIREGAVTAPSDAGISDESAARRRVSSAARLRSALEGELDAIVMQALRREPLRRYPSVDSLADDLQRFLRGARVLARPDTMTYRLRTVMRRRRALSAGLAVGLVAMVAISVLSLLQARSMRAEAARSERASMYLMRMVGVPDAHFGNPFARIGPNGRVAEMLDSALARVPEVFSDEPRIRARVYTALGAGIAATGRVREAALVLDSARVLARQSYGERSTAYAEATIDAANVALHWRSPADAAVLSTEAIGILESLSDVPPDLISRARLSLASVFLLDGRLTQTDSIAQRVIASELARTTAPTMARAWALRLRGAVEAFRGKDASPTYRHVIAVVDSIGARRSIERLDATFELAYLALGTNRDDAAEALARDGLAAARDGFGEDSREVALLETVPMQLALRRGDLPGALALAAHIEHVIDSLPDLNSAVLLSTTFTRRMVLVAAGQHDRADSLVSSTLQRMERLQAAYPLTLMYGLASASRESMGDLAGSQQMLERLLAVSATRPDLAVFAGEAHLRLARVLARQARIPPRPASR